MKYILRSLAVFLMLFALPAFADSSASSTSPPTSTDSPQVVQTPQTSDQQAVNINTADASSIISAHLRGIGEKRAAAIVAYRTQHGPFKSVDDLKNIKGISQKVIDDNRSRIVIS